MIHERLNKGSKINVFEPVKKSAAQNIQRIKQKKQGKVERTRNPVGRWFQFMAKNRHNLSFKRNQLWGYDQKARTFNDTTQFYGCQKKHARWGPRKVQTCRGNKSCESQNINNKIPRWCPLRRLWWLLHVATHRYQQIRDQNWQRLGWSCLKLDLE